MTVAGAILLVAIGAILTFATNIHVRGIDFDIVGWILMIAGAAGLIFALFQDAIWNERARRREAAAEGQRDAPPSSREPPPRY